MTDGIHFLQDGKFVAAEDMVSAREPRLIPRHLLVTGVGRGGTTAAAMVVENLGFEAERPTPYRESVNLRGFILNGDATGAIAHLESWPRDGARMFWKDPKLWVEQFDPCLQQMRDDIGLIVILRDPLNIASRNQRLTSNDLLDELERAVGAQRKLAARIKHFRNRNLALMSYEKLVINPRLIIGALVRFLGLEGADIAAAVACVEPSPEHYESHFGPRKTT